MRKKVKYKKVGGAVLGVVFALLFAVLGNMFVDDVPTSNTTPVVNQLNTDAAVSVHFIDVGQGDSVFIQLPDNQTMLIDAGENDYGSTVVNYIKGIQDKSVIDYVVATHPHSDHIGGMDDVISAFDIKNFYMPDCTNNTATFEKMLDALLKKGISVTKAEAGVTICEKDNLKIEILSPTTVFNDLNNYSAVVRLTYGDVKYLFMGDAEKEAENLMGENVSADVLKVGHHGSSTSTGDSFLNKVNPKIAVISSGKNNEYGHPHRETLEKLNLMDVNVLRTDEKSTIIVSTDGKSLFY